MFFLLIFLYGIIVFIQKNVIAKTIHIKQVRGYDCPVFWKCYDDENCISYIYCDGSEQYPVESLAEALSMVTDSKYDLQDNFLEILFEPNLQNKPYLITDFELDENPSLLRPFYELRGKNILSFMLNGIK